MRRLALLCVGLALLFVILMLAAQAVGARNYQPPTLLSGLSACDSPCWNGITVGRTSISEADKILHAHGYMAVGAYDALNLVYRVGQRDCWVTVTMFNRQVVGLRFSACGNLHVGDLALLYGLPEQLIFTAGVGDSLLWNAELLDATVSGWQSPFARVTDFGLTAGGSAQAGTPWHGFVPFWRYCQLERVPFYCPDGVPLNGPP